MAELGRIHPLKKMACQHCRGLLPEWSVDEVLAAEHLVCPHCQGEIRLPDELMRKLIDSKNLGRNLDITG